MRYQGYEQKDHVCHHSRDDGWVIILIRRCAQTNDGDESKDWPGVLPEVVDPGPQAMITIILFCLRLGNLLVHSNFIPA